jgi:hypothetical protein
MLPEGAWVDVKRNSTYRSQQQGYGSFCDNCGSMITKSFSELLHVPPLVGDVQAVRYALALTLHYRIPSLAKQDETMIFKENVTKEYQHPDIVFLHDMQALIQPGTMHPDNARPGVVRKDIEAITSVWDTFARERHLKTVKQCKT